MKYLFTTALVALLGVGAYFYFQPEIPKIDDGSGSTDSGFSLLDKDSRLLEESPSPSISIEYLRSLEIDSPAPIIEQELSPGSNYLRYIASYTSDGNKIYGLLTVPDTDPPDGGFPAIVFNHGYIPPAQYSTTEKYIAYVDSLARSGFVVFKIDLRGNGDSEGSPSGSYFSSGYTIDAINAVKSLQKFTPVNPDRIGMWGHSMSGNLTLRAMEVSDDIKAGVIWAGAVYSYKDFAQYRLNDTSYVGRERPDRPDQDEDKRRLDPKKTAQLREDPESIDWNNSFWSGISLTSNLNYLNAPLELHHAVDDPVVNIGYSRDLAQKLEENGKTYEIYEYSGGGHNINSPYFEAAMQRTIEFYKENL